MKHELMSYSVVDEDTNLDEQAEFEEWSDVLAKCEDCGTVFLVADATTDIEVDNTNICSFTSLALYCEILEKFQCIPDEGHEKWREFLSYLDEYAIQHNYIQEKLPLILKTIEYGIRPYTYSVSENDIKSYFQGHKF